MTHDISSRTPEGEANRCGLCGFAGYIEPSLARDAACPNCGSLLWFLGDAEGLTSERFAVPLRMRRISRFMRPVHAAGRWVGSLRRRLAGR